MPDETIDQLKAGLAEAEQQLWLNLNSPTGEFNASWSRILGFCQKLRRVMQAKSSSASLKLQEAYDVDSKFLEIYGLHLLTTLKEYRRRKGLF